MDDNDMSQQIFENARTYRSFKDKAINDDVIHQLYELVKWAPTASNLCPMRISFVKSEAQKQQVIAAAAAGNQAKIESAPLVAIIAYDSAFHNHIEVLAPHMNADAFRSQCDDVLEQVAIENCWLQGGFLIAAARSLGLDCGPMAGFDKSKIDEAFYSDTTWHSAFLMNLGYGDASQLHPRGARLSFNEACEIL